MIVTADLVEQVFFVSFVRYSFILWVRNIFKINLFKKILQRIACTLCCYDRLWKRITMMMPAIRWRAKKKTLGRPTPHSKWLVEMAHFGQVLCGGPELGDEFCNWISFVLSCFTLGLFAFNVQMFKFYRTSRERYPIQTQFWKIRNRMQIRLSPAIWMFENEHSEKCVQRKLKMTKTHATKECLCRRKIIVEFQRWMPLNSESTIQFSLIDKSSRNNQRDIAFSSAVFCHCDNAGCVEYWRSYWIHQCTPTVSRSNGHHHTTNSHHTQATDDSNR